MGQGSDPPGTWVSNLSSRLRSAGGHALADAARVWYHEAVSELLSDPKHTDAEGDYFYAWLRECHREVYDDIDTSDPAKIRDADWVRSESSDAKKDRYKVKDITIPGYSAA